MINPYNTGTEYKISGKATINQRKRNIAPRILPIATMAESEQKTQGKAFCRLFELVCQHSFVYAGLLVVCFAYRSLIRSLLRLTK